MNINALPPDLQPLCTGNWQKITVGNSGNAVYRISDSHNATRYLKVANLSSSDELLAEKERLLWLSKHLPVPAVLFYATDDFYTYLLISELKGCMSFDAVFADDIAQVVQLLAEGLRRLHAVDIRDCPFDETLDHKIVLAREHVQAGLVDEDDFDESRKGMRAEDLLARLLAQRPASEDLVFTHGDYCLPNVLIDPEQMRLSGFIDLGRAGVADRYQDLALAVRSLTYNFGAEWVPLLLTSYGLSDSEVDTSEIEYYQLLDEFF